MTKKTKKPGHKLPFIAIIGKPNVGKSSLFNRIVGEKVAITSEIAGTTRDRVFRRVRLENLTTIFVDTGGLEFEKKRNIEADMQAQARLAIGEADLILFIVDGREDPTIDDVQTANILRRQSKKVIFVANKIDHAKSSHNLLTWTELGFGEPVSVSVIHNLGIEKLQKIILQQLKTDGWEESEEYQEPANSIKLAIIGRPNAGKSSLVNALVGTDRVIVSEEAGTTRDAIDIELHKDGQNYTLIDTAGLRRRGKIEKGIEKYSSFRTIDAIERSDIVCLILDYEVGIRAQDLHISSYILEANKGLILIVNKIDLMENKEVERNSIARLLKHRFDYLSWAPVLFVSAKNHKNLEHIFENAINIFHERKREIDPDDLVDFIRDKFHKHQPPSYGRKKLVFYDLKQFTSYTPTFEYLVNNKEIIHFSYQRYLENEFREQFGFMGTSVRFFYKSIDPKLLRDAKPL
jgi:GTP-binding protein